MIGRLRLADRRHGSLPTAWLVGIAAGMLLLGVGLRFLRGFYSDIIYLYDRDQLWRAPVPYVDYPLEYPVGMGALIWLAGAVTGGRTAFFLFTAAIMVGAGLLLVWLAGRFEEADLRLLALSPALPLYVVLNWDLAALAPMVAALLLLRRDRPGWAAVLLTAAIWTKFFPLVVVPLALLDRALRRRWRQLVVFGGGVAIGSALVNAPFALERTPDGLRVREAWLYFFRFNQARPPEVNAWRLLDLAGIRLNTEQVNAYSGVLLVLGLGVAMLLLALGRRRTASGAATRDLLLPASLVALGWWFFVNKVYSPQYSLWLAVLLALLGAPPALAVAFAAVDVAYFTVTFAALAAKEYSGWVGQYLLLPAMALREATILAIVGWAARQIVRPAGGAGAGDDPPSRARRPDRTDPAYAM